ncbi:MAG: S-methyl-5-thioribose-1-phosphate isomerase [Bradymonadaceae bacterium]
MNRTRTSEGHGADLETDVQPLKWIGELEDGYLEMLDQRRLPAEEHWLVMTEMSDVAEGIEEMVVRGAPAIGIAAAYGVVLAVRSAVVADVDPLDAGEEAIERLSETRPTAVNLRWALRRMGRELEDASEEADDDLLEVLFDEARAIFENDRRNNRRMGRHGAELLPDDAGVLTHCNTGGLATGGFGTALGVIRAADAEGKLQNVWVDETRPYLQGARLTAWECREDDLPATLITDNMAAHFMKRGDVDAVVVGADRVAANGDVANKIGTYNLAVLCDAHRIPLYVAAPLSTIDLETPDGDSIPIEQRGRDEIARVGDAVIVPDDVEVAHPAFDITPAPYVAAIVTEHGVAEPPYEESLRALKQD